jgi:hypothetical protein
MKIGIAVCVCGCAVTAFALSATAHGAEPTWRETLRRYASHRNEVVQHEPPPGYPADASHFIALEYAVQLRRDGLDEPVDPATYRFHTGDQIRVRIQPFNELYVYVFFEDEQGCRHCLLPTDKNSPRLAKRDQPIELPTDGTVFEFEAGSKGETLVLVASNDIDADLSTLCDAVCKKRDATLTPDERSTQLALRQRNDKALRSIFSRQTMAVAYRGQLSTKALMQVSAEMEERSALDATILEPPGKDEPSTLAMFISKSESPLRLAVTIPLESADGPNTASP